MHKVVQFKFCSSLTTNQPHKKSIAWSRDPSGILGPIHIIGITIVMDIKFRS